MLEGGGGGGGGAQSLVRSAQHLSDPGQSPSREHETPQLLLALDQLVPQRVLEGGGGGGGVGGGAQSLVRSAQHLSDPGQSPSTEHEAPHPLLALDQLVPQRVLPPPTLGLGGGGVGGVGGGVGGVGEESSTL